MIKMKSLPQKLKKSIEYKANELSKFHITGREIGFEGASRNLNNWVQNFNGLLDNLDVINDLVMGLSFLDDSVIRKNIFYFIEQYIPHLDLKNSYFTCLGEQTESSARIISQLNNFNNYFPNMQKCLGNIRLNSNEKPNIIFMDDFINSGGQFASIISQWFQPQLNDNTRISLNRKEIETIKNCELYFFFQKGMERGRIKGEEVFKKYELKANIRTITQYDDNIGIFGSKDTLERIRQGVDGGVGEEIFSNYKCSEITQLLSICEEIGEKLLKINKPNWKNKNKNLYKERSLGYGNSAQLDITQNNIPTSTLTCLWLGGEFNYKGKTINWKPLFQRREKIIGGSESNNLVTNNIETTAVNNFLNKNKKAAAPYEIMLIDEIKTTDFNIQDLKFKDITGSYTKNIETDFTSFFNNSNFPFQILAINPNSYGKFNNRLFYFLNEEINLSCKIKSIHVIIINNVRYISIRISFKYKLLSVDNIRAINHSISMFENVDENKYNNIFVYGNKKEKISLKDLLSNVFLENNIKYSFKHDRMKHLIYIRTNSSLFKNKKQFSEVFSNLASLARREDVPENYTSFIELDYECRIGFSGKGVLLINGGDKLINLSFNSEFYDSYYFVYCLALFLKQIKVSLLMNTISENNEKFSMLLKLYGEFDWFDDNHIWEFTKLLKKELKLE